MDPTLQTFLRTTGWSKEDLIRKLVADEKIGKNDTDFVTSTTSNKDSSTARHANKEDAFKTAKGIHMDVEIVDVDLYSYVPSPSQSETLPLFDDLLLKINTSNSYLPPLNNTKNQNQKKPDQSDVIDLDSDSESLDPKENHIEKQVDRGNVIDISTDSDESVKAVDNLYDPISDCEIVSELDNSPIKKVTTTTKQPVKDISKYIGLVQESTEWEKYVGSQLKDIDYEERNNEDTPYKSHHREARHESDRCSNNDTLFKKKRRHRSNSDNRYREDSHRKHMIRHSRSRSRPHRTKSRSSSKSCSSSRRNKSRSRSTSRRRSRSKRVKSRGRSRSRNRRRSSPIRSRSNRSRSGSINREVGSRSRKRTRSRSRSIEGNNARYSKVSKTIDQHRSHHGTSRESIDPITSYMWRRVSPPKQSSSDVPACSTTALKDPVVRLKKKSSKMTTSLAKRLRLLNNLSENKISRSNTYIMFKNIAAEENGNNDAKMEPKHTVQKIQLKRKTFIVQSDDSNKKLANKSELGTVDGRHCESTGKVALLKNFVEMKDMNLSTEVSQLILSADQSNENDTNAPQESLIPKCPVVMESAAHTRSKSTNNITNTNTIISKEPSPIGNEEIIEVLITDKNDEIKHKSLNKTYNYAKIKILQNITLAKALPDKEAANSVASQPITSEDFSEVSDKRVNDCVVMNALKDPITNSKVIKIPKQVHSTVESLPGKLTDIIDKSDAKLGKGKPESDTDSHITTVKNQNINQKSANENLFGICADNFVTKTLQKSDSNNGHFKIRNNSTKLTVTVDNMSEVVDSTSNNKKLEIQSLKKIAADCHNKFLVVLKMQDITTDQLVDDKEVVPCDDNEKFVRRQGLPTLTAGDSSIQSQNEIVQSTDSQHLPDFMCADELDVKLEENDHKKVGIHQKAELLISAALPLIRIQRNKQIEDLLNTISDLTKEVSEDVSKGAACSFNLSIDDVYNGEATLEDNGDTVEIKESQTSICDGSEQIANLAEYISNVQAIHAESALKKNQNDCSACISSPYSHIGSNQKSSERVCPTEELMKSTEDLLTGDRKPLVNSPESQHLVKVSVPPDRLLHLNEICGVEDESKISKCNILRSETRCTRIDAKEIHYENEKHIEKAESKVLDANNFKRVSSENQNPNVNDLSEETKENEVKKRSLDSSVDYHQCVATMAETFRKCKDYKLEKMKSSDSNTIYNDKENFLCNKQEEPQHLLPGASSSHVQFDIHVEQSHKTEETKIILDAAVETSMEVDKDDVNLKPSETDDDDTPFLDIEAILKKCFENQERALKEKEAEKNSPPIPVRRTPKNRRPDFSFLRDKSTSTIKIQLMLEQRVKEKCSPHEIRHDNEIINSVNVKDSATNPLWNVKPLSVLAKESANENFSNQNEKINVTRSDSSDFGKPFYDQNWNDDIRNQILKQLDILKDKRKDFAFSSSINPIIIPRVTRKKTFAKLLYTSAGQNDKEEEINIINESLESPTIWLTKTADYKKIKGWKNKSIGVKVKKCPKSALIEESFAIPSCSFHNSDIDNLTDNVEPDKINEVEKESTESKIIEHEEDAVSIESEPNAFSSSMLDEFMLDKSKVELKISYEIPALLMGPSVLKGDAFNESLFKGVAKYDVSSKQEKLTKDVSKPRTLAEKRRLLKMEVVRNVPTKITNQSGTKPAVIKSIEVNENCFKTPARRTMNDDISNVGHNKRKDFAIGSVYWKGKKFVVPCHERKVIYFRTKVSSRYFVENSKDELSPPPNLVDRSQFHVKVVPPKAILWSPETVIKQPLPPHSDRKQNNVLYRAGPMCNKPELILDATKSWECVIKPLPKVFLEITAEYGKSVHPRALQFLYTESYVDLSKDRVDFALSALRDSQPIKYKLPVFYKNGQTQFTLRKKIVKELEPKTPPACGDISSEVKEVVDDILTCLEIHDIQDTLIKDDPDLAIVETPKKMMKSPCKKDTKESSVTTRVSAINKRLRIALGRLQVKFIDIDIDEDPNRACDKAYCQYGCVCSSLVGVLSSKEHCRRIECVLDCICGYKPPVNTTVILPAGSDLELSSTVDKLQSEATKNLAKVEKEFTQTIVCTKNETYVLGETADRKRRCTRAPKKYEDFLKVKTVQKDEEPKQVDSMSHLAYIRKMHGVDVTDCSIRIEKVDMYHIIPFCWTHEEYKCECLKEFLIARSEEKANNLALQLEADVSNENAEEISKNDVAPKMTKSGLRKKMKWGNKKYSAAKQNKLNLIIKQAKMISIENNFAETVVDEVKDTDETNSQSLEDDEAAIAIASKPDVQDNQQPKSTSRRKQVLSTMVDVSENHSVQVRVRKELVQVKRPPVDKSADRLMQNNDRDLLKFLLPTSNVRLQFLKMLGKNEQSKDEFRLLSFLVLSNRFQLNLFHVWYSPTAVISKYILSMDNIRPAREYVNVRQLASDMKTDNYLIQWLIEGTVPVAEVQDFLVILKVISNKRFDICGMCEKSKIEYTNEPLTPLLATPSAAATKLISTPTPSPVTLKAPTLANMAYDIPGSTVRQTRKILNIQSEKIPSISGIYPSVALTGQSGLIHASLPSINGKFRWLILSFSSTFAVLNMTTTNYCIPHEQLVELVEESRRSNSTMMFKNKGIRGKAVHHDFAIYVTPQHKKYFFIGPYHVNETITCETLCYYKNMLVSTENFNKIHGNPDTPIGCWSKQLQMKVHSAATTTIVSANTSILRPILPKATVTAPPPQLVKISDYMEAKKGKQATSAMSNQMTTKTNFLIVNNSVVSASAAVLNNVPVTTTATAIDSPKPIPIYTVPTSSGINASNSATPIVSTGTCSNNTTDCVPTFNIGNEDISLLGLDYRDAEFKNKQHKTLQYLVTNIPGFGYVRIYRCNKTNITYLMWRFVKMYKSVLDAKKSLITLIENTVIVVPANFKIVISVLNAKPLNLKLVNSDYYFDTYIAGRFGVHLLGNLSADTMINYLKLDKVDVQYINEKSAGMLLKKCYNIASTFLTKDDLARIRNWKDMLTALKGTIDTENETEVKLMNQLKKERYQQLALQNKLKVLTENRNSSSINEVAPTDESSDVIEISDEEDLMPKLDPEIIVEEQNVNPSAIGTGGTFSIQPKSTSVGQSAKLRDYPLIHHRVGVKHPYRISSTTKTNTQQRNVRYVSNMGQNFKGPFKLLPHKQNSVLITRIRNPTAIAKTFKHNDL